MDSTAAFALTPNHAYEVADAFERDGQRWVRLRNPHGQIAPNYVDGSLAVSQNSEGELPFSVFAQYFEYLVAA